MQAQSNFGETYFRVESHDKPKDLLKRCLRFKVWRQFSFLNNKITDTHGDIITVRGFARHKANRILIVS